ncbi:MAG: copper resistance protein NlpE [Chitinivibrionia bacterium]|nr:copper resistance protein NlpE [Chitinivibrionia bacterium]
MQTKKVFYKLAIFTVSVIVLMFFLVDKKNIENEDFSAYEYLITYHNSRNALDWWGEYAGVLPCADCEGIDTRITLNRDETFFLFWQYLSKSDSVFNYSGTFVWNESGSAIILGADNFPQHFQVGEGRLFLLDKDGKRIKGALEDKYILTKID